MNGYFAAELVKIRQTVLTAEASRARLTGDSRRARTGRQRTEHLRRKIQWTPRPKPPPKPGIVTPYPVITVRRLEQDS
jgi:hypothetical protein